MRTIYFGALLTIAVGFAVFFFVTIGPLLIEDPRIFEAFKAGFVNPYASGFSTDVIACWLILAVWIVYERNNNDIKYGWVSLLLGLVPGVATGFALYLILRSYQLTNQRI